MKLKELIGKPSIHPFLFYGSKISLGIFFILFLSGFFPINGWFDLVEFSFKLVLILLLMFSIVNLGSSFKVGLPQESEIESLKTWGLYSFSRNPIYTFSFFIIIIVLKDNWSSGFVWLGAIFVIFFHHQIVLKEEEYLSKRWSTTYEDYKKRVKRYGFF